MNDLKAGIVKNATAVSLNCYFGGACLSDTNESIDDGELEDDALIPEPEDMPKVIEQKLVSVLLKLGNCFHVPASAVDELLSELHYLVSSALVPAANKILTDFFSNRNLQVEQ